MGEGGEGCGSPPGVPSPAKSPPGRAPPLSPPRCSCINCASAARGGRSHGLGRAPATLSDPRAVPGAPAEISPVSSPGDPTAPR